MGQKFGFLGSEICFFFFYEGCGGLRPVDFRLNLGHFGPEIWDFWVRNLGFLVVKGGWLRPVDFGIKSGLFGSEIWVFGVRNLFFFFL